MFLKYAKILEYWWSPAGATSSGDSLLNYLMQIHIHLTVMSSNVMLLMALLTAARNISAPAGVNGFFPTCVHIQNTYTRAVLRGEPGGPRLQTAVTVTFPNEIFIVYLGWKFNYYMLVYVKNCISEHKTHKIFSVTPAPRVPTALMLQMLEYQLVNSLVSTVQRALGLHCTID